MCSHNSGGKVNGRARPAWWAPILFAAAVLQPVRCDVKTAAEQWTAAFPGQVALANFSVVRVANFSAQTARCSVCRGSQLRQNIPL
jgi:hypothetical protein